MKIIMSGTNANNHNDDFLKKYNEVFKDSFTADKSETAMPEVTVKPVVHKEKKEIRLRPKNIFYTYYKKILSVFKRRNDGQASVKNIDIDIYSTDDIDLPLDLPKNLMDPESTEIQLTMFEGVEDSETYQDILNAEEKVYTESDTSYCADDENENQIRIEDLIKESIIRDRKEDPYADKLNYDENEQLTEDNDETDKFGDTMVFEPVKSTGFAHYKSIDEILNDINSSSEDDDSDSGNIPRRRRSGAAD